MKIHAIHQQIGDVDIGFGDAPFDLVRCPITSNVVEEQRLALLLVGKDVQPAAARAVKHMPD